MVSPDYDLDPDMSYIASGGHVSQLSVRMTAELLTMISNPSHTHSMLSILRSEITINILDKAADLLIICKNGERVKAHKTIFKISSKFLRDLLGELSADVVHLPEFEKVSVEKVVSLVSMRDESDMNTWTMEDIELLYTLGINVEGFDLKVKTELETDIESIGVDQKESNVNLQDVKNYADIETSAERNQNYLDFNLSVQKYLGTPEPKKSRDIVKQIPTIKAISKTDNKTKRVQKFPTKEFSTKCPMCSRRFSGRFGRLKDMLRCHIGNVHFHTELVSQFDQYYEGTKGCVDCGKRFENLTPGNEMRARKKHLVFNHSNYSRVITNIVLETIQEVVDKDEDASKLIAKTCEDGKSTEQSRKSTSNKSVYFCLKCDRDWPSSPATRKYIKRHMVTHMKDEFMPHIAASFCSSSCLKCDKIISAESEQRLHLYEKHSFLASVIGLLVDEIYNRQSESKDIKIEENLENNSEMVLQAEETLEQQIQDDLMMDLWDDDMGLSDDELNDEGYTKMIQMKILDDLDS